MKGDYIVPITEHSKKSPHCDLAVVSTVPMTMEAFLASGMLLAEENGLKVRGLCSDTDHACIQRLRSHGIKVDGVPLTRQISPLKDFRALYTLWRSFRRTGVTIVHTHTPKAGFLGQIAAWLACVPFRVNTVHGLFFVNQPATKRMAFRYLEIWACYLAHKILCVSQEDADYLVSKCRISPHKIMVQPVGVDLDRFDRSKHTPLEREAVRRTLDLPLDGFVVGIVARMVSEKGFRELFEAIRILMNKQTPVYLLHVGEPDLSRADGLDTALVNEMGISSLCRFVGRQNDVAKYLAAMDIFCLPSYREGFPVSVMEAMAMGLPCVVTDIRGCREAVRNGKDGYVVPARDSGALTEAIENLLQSPSERAEMGDSASARARKCFCRHRLDLNVIRLYKTAVQREGTGSNTC